MKEWGDTPGAFQLEITTYGFSSPGQLRKLHEERSSKMQKSNEGTPNATRLSFRVWYPTKLATYRKS